MTHQAGRGIDIGSVDRWAVRSLIFFRSTPKEKNLTTETPKVATGYKKVADPEVRMSMNRQYANVLSAAGGNGCVARDGNNCKK